MKKTSKLFDPMHTVMSNAPEEEEIVIETSTPKSVSSGKIENAGEYSRSATRQPRIIRISKVPSTTTSYRIIRVDENHNIQWEAATLNQAMEASKKTGIPLNLS